MAIKPVEVDRNEDQPNKILDILGYLIFIIPLCTMKNEFDRYHANQATVLAICAIVLNALVSIMARMPIIRWFSGIAYGVLSLCVLVLMIIGMVNAANLECKPLPIIGELFQIVKY